MPYALPLTDLISQQSRPRITHRTLSAKLGDGYSQEVPDGINTKETVWDLVFPNLTTEEADELLGVLDAVGGWDYLTWNSKKYKIVEGRYELSYPSGVHVTVSFALREIP